MGLAHKVIGTQWIYETVRLGLNGTSTQMDWYTFGLGHSENGT